MASLDQKDRKLLYEIDLNARLGTSTLGKHIGLSQEGTFYRLQKLEKKNIITGYMTLLDFGKIGYTGYGVYARFQNVKKEEKAAIIRELAEHDHIYWIAEFGGRFDLAFAIMARNIVHFNEIYSELTTKYTEVLKDFTVSIRVELAQFPRDYLIEKKRDMRKKAPSFGKYIEQEDLDDLDTSILQQLTNNARMPVLEMSKHIGRPASTIASRIKQLEKKEIIQGYSTQIQCQEFGYESYQLFLSVHNLTQEKKKALFSYCYTHPNIVFYIETVGKWNFEIIYEIKDQKELQDLIIEMRTQFSDIIFDVESIVLFNHYVKYNQYPLEDGGGSCGIKTRVDKRTNI